MQVIKYVSSVLPLPKYNPGYAAVHTVTTNDWKSLNQSLSTFTNMLLQSFLPFITNLVSINFAIEFIKCTVHDTLHALSTTKVFDPRIANIEHFNATKKFNFYCIEVISNTKLLVHANNRNNCSFTPRPLKKFLIIIYFYVLQYNIL